jgi:hypothetical protein
MTAVLFAVVLLLAAIAIVGGTFFTIRWFIAAGRPPVEVKPKRAKSNPHDAATTAHLKQFFGGKECAACGRPIAPVHAGELHPGLLNTNTHEAIAWEDIPAADLSTTLASHATICASCVTVETFRREYPDRVVDRHRNVQHPSH